MASNPTRTCPACGARNNDRSLFCAECGVGLALTSDAWNDSQPTQSFEPVRSETEWQRPVDDQQRTASGGYPAVDAPAPYATFDQGRAETRETSAAALPPESRRGFWLGLLGWILIAIVIGMYVWAGVLGEQFKDDIRDIVPGLSQIILLRP